MNCRHADREHFGAWGLRSSFIWVAAAGVSEADMDGVAGVGGGGVDGGMWGRVDPYMDTFARDG